MLVAAARRRSPRIVACRRNTRASATCDSPKAVACNSLPHLGPNASGTLTVRFAPQLANGDEGKVIEVETVAGEPKLAAFVRGKLLGLTSGARAVGGKTLATWTVTLAVR